MFRGFDSRNSHEAGKASQILLLQTFKHCCSHVSSHNISNKNLSHNPDLDKHPTTTNDPNPAREHTAEHTANLATRRFAHSPMN